MKKNLIFLLAIPLFIISLFSLKAQEINATITVNVEQLPDEYRVNVQTLEADLERYINNQKFTDLEWEGPGIPVDMTIYLTGGANGRYGARMFFTSKRYLYGQEGGASVVTRMIEEQWAFEYARGAALTYNPYRYDEITSIIDFYMNYIIGMDLDTYGELDGTEQFMRAKDILQRAAAQQAPGFDTYSKPGQFTKSNLINDLTDLRYEPLRILFFEYYVDGLDMMADDEEQAMKNIVKFVDDLVDFKKNKMISASSLLQAFFDAKVDELANMFRRYDNKEDVLNKLMYLDPTNSTKYREALEN